MERVNDLPTSFLTDCVVDGLQLCYYLPECWPFCWILIPALCNQSVSKYIIKDQQNVNYVTNHSHAILY